MQIIRNNSNLLKKLQIAIFHSPVFKRFWNDLLIKVSRQNKDMFNLIVMNQLTVYGLISE